MKYLVNLNDNSNEIYSREEVQSLIDKHRIGLETEIWTEEWSEWRKVKQTDFILIKAVDLKPRKSDSIYSKKISHNVL